MKTCNNDFNTVTLVESFRNKHSEDILFKSLISERGAAYILTVIVTLVLFSICSTLLYIFNNEILTVSNYKENMGGYEAAVSGVTYACDFLRSKIEENRKLIDELTFNKILSIPLYEIAYYNQNAVSVYEGEFRLKTSDGCLYHRHFAKYAIEALSDTFSEGCNLQITGVNASYNVAIEISEGTDGLINIKSTAINEKTGVSDKVLATACFNFCTTEVFEEDYLFNTLPPYLQGGIYSTGELVNDSSILNAPDALFNQEEFFPNTAVSGLRVFNIINSELDISNFVNQNGTEPAVVNYNGGSEMLITASEPENNFFNGIIISKNGITVENTTVHIKGHIYCEGNLKLINANLTVEYKNILPEISFSSISEKREFLNKIGAIDFNAATSSLTGIKISRLFLPDKNAGTLVIKSLKKSG